MLPFDVGLEYSLIELYVGEYTVYIPLMIDSVAHEEDIWTEIAKYLDGKSLVMLAATSKWFLQTITHDSVWKFACLRDLQEKHIGNLWIHLD
ncbi:f-box protein [Artemisia annua]|uniref:F-box protein n=1 Tax=Artemisia annua TaxID=35608 RepID=A0A2U1Q2P2_ARTAN|nr:f-box protein [Artemisia annua]